MSAPQSKGDEVVLLALPDVHGQLRGKALSQRAFESACRTGTTVTDLLLALDPRDQPITTYTRLGIRAGAGDLQLQPDEATLRPMPWRPGWSICLATPRWRDGSPCELGVREVLRSALVDLEQTGHDALAAVEYEFRVTNLDGKALPSSLSYSLADIGHYEELIAALGPALSALGVELAAVHTEPGSGLIELNLTAQYGMLAADNAALAKFCVKDVCATMGLRASFLAKHTEVEEGSSGHVHLSLWRAGENAFANAGGEGPLTGPFGAAVAGILKHLPAASLLYNPTINSYKRLVPGWFTPVNVSWGDENRSCAVRVIRSQHPDRCRLECRRPGADANPYLVLAALVASACDGLERGSSAPPPIEGDASEREALEKLPASLESALAAFERDADFRDALGRDFSEYFAVSRRWELEAWQKDVSDWERERYAGVV